MQRVMVGSAAT